MNKIRKMFTGLLLFLITIVSIFTIAIYSFQKSLTKDMVASLLDQIDTSTLIIHYSDKKTGDSLVTIHDYISKSMNLIGVDEKIIDNDVVNNYIESLSDALLTDIIYNYLNNEKMVIDNTYEEVGEISKILTKAQRVKLEEIINQVNREVISYMDETFEEYEELKLVKAINNFDVKILLIVLILLMILTFIIAPDKLRIVKKIIGIIGCLIFIMILFDLSYKYILANIILNLEKFGNMLQIFLNNFSIQINKIWKILAIMDIFLLFVYLVINYISKQTVNKGK